MEVFPRSVSDGQALVEGPCIIRSQMLHAGCTESLISEIRTLQSRNIQCVSLMRRRLFRIGEECAVDMLKESGISIGSISYAGGFTGTLGMSFDQAVLSTMRAIGLAARCDARFVVVLPGGKGYLTPRHLRSTAKAGLLECAEHALRSGVMLAVPDAPLLKTGVDHFEPCDQKFRAWISDVRHPALTLLARTNALSDESRERLDVSHQCVMPDWIVSREPTGHSGINCENKEAEIEFFVRSPIGS